MIDQLLKVFGDVQPFLTNNTDLALTTRNKLLGFMSDTTKRSTLELEISVIVDAGAPLVSPLGAMIEICNLTACPMLVINCVPADANEPFAFLVSFSVWHRPLPYFKGPWTPSSRACHLLSAISMTSWCRAEWIRTT